MYEPVNYDCEVKQLMNLPNIAYNGDISKFVTPAEYDDYEAISFYKDKEYFLDSVNFSNFVKAVERQVRTSDDYKKFISYIKNELGVNFCQVSSKIYGSDEPGAKITVELHHGPLFTLYDIASVITNWFIMTDKKITTFRVTDKVLDEHFALRVQCIMLAKTNHEAVHNRDIFLHLNQGIGDIDAFIKAYTPFLDDEQKYKIWNYINLCEETNFGKSFDRGFLDTEYIKKYMH